MSIVHYADHQVDVRTVLPCTAKAGDKLGGIEIETGFVSEAKRSAFMKLIEKKGYGDKCISKHDGTIGTRGATYPAEIVSVPMPFDELRKFAGAVGEAIESTADKGLITTGCGVHIHVSEGMFADPDVLWRYAATIHQDAAAITDWLRQANTTREAMIASPVLHKFLDAVCLRKQGDYCLRNPYYAEPEVRGSRSHNKAFIHGRNSPTFETRIFRTPKSHRILRSYVDFVAGLIDYSENSHTDHLEVMESKLTSKQFAELRAALQQPLAWITTPGTGITVFYDVVTGQQYTTDDITVVDGHYYVKTTRSRRRIPTANEVELLQNGSNSKGARGWAEGIPNLKDFMRFIIESGKYPDLAQRLGYEKFSAYASPQVGAEFDIEAAHTEYKPGCHVRLEGGRGETYALMHNNGSDGTRSGVDQWMLDYIKRSDSGGPFVRGVNLFIHACPGATSCGGEV